MTQSEQQLIIRILQHGFSTGSRHRYECLESYIHCYPNEKEAAIAACAAFERGMGWCYESTEKLAAMTDEDFYTGYVLPYCERQLVAV